MMDKEALRILIVDDSKVMRGIIRKMLKPWTTALVLEARDGKEAWEVLQREPVDIIISDWNMPRMKGIELLKRVRASEIHADIPFVMVTAEAMDVNQAEAGEARVSGYLTKPFTPEKLRRAIETTLG